MTSFQDLRQRRHAQWLTELKQQISELHERFFARTGETPTGQLQQLVEGWAREALAAG